MTEYEDLTAAIAMIDAARELISFYRYEEEEYLNTIRTRLDDYRVELLGNGKTRPYFVSGLKLTGGGE